jgi:predicted DCC family thiol-disulfide oxidoreductase YuxK
MQREAAKPAIGEHPIIAFDGVCNLCNGFVQFVLRRDPGAKFRFLPLQALSETEREEIGLAGKRGAGTTVALIDGERVHVKSTAALRAVAALGGPWTMVRAALVVPRPLRDAAYDLVARHRYRLFGRRAECAVPTADVRARFLSDLSEAETASKAAI